MIFSLAKQIARKILPKKSYMWLVDKWGIIRRRAILEWEAHSADWDVKPPLLVYQIGKVGSTSVFKSLKVADLPFSLYHIHFLSHDRFTNHIRELKKAGYVLSPTDVVYTKKHSQAYEKSPLRRFFE